MQQETIRTVYSTSLNLEALSMKKNVLRRINKGTIHCFIGGIDTHVQSRMNDQNLPKPNV